MRCAWCGAILKTGFHYEVVKQRVEYPEEDVFAVVDLNEAGTMHRRCAADFLRQP